MIFFHLHTVTLAVLLFGVILGATLLGLYVGRSLRHRSDAVREPFAVMQGTLLGFMALILAFGLSLGVSRHEARRAAVVVEANAIGTTYLRAQTLAEPQRTRSLDLLDDYADLSILISQTVPGSDAQLAGIDRSDQLQRQLWQQAGESLDAAPVASAPRLYVETLNEMFDAQTAHIAALGNRVPTTVLMLEVAGAAVALFMLAVHLSVLGRGLVTSVVAAVLVSLTLFVTFDLDRPTRGFIEVPSTPLDNARANMEAPPAYEGPDG